MKHTGITHKVLKRFAKLVPDKGKFALRKITNAKNNAERSALARMVKFGLIVKTGYGEYQRTSADPIKDYYDRRHKRFAARGGRGKARKKRRKLDSIDKALADRISAVRVTQWDDDGNYLINIGDRRFLGTEVAVVKRDGKEVK